MRGWRARARLALSCVPVYEFFSALYHARHQPRSTEAHCIVSTHCFLPSTFFSLLNGRSAESPCGPVYELFSALYHARHQPRSTEAHCIVATHYFLPSTLSPLPSSMDARQNCRAGALERAIHALPSTFFSLLPTLEAHCIVATHYFLPSALFSLLFPCSFHLVQSTWMSP